MIDENKELLKLEQELIMKLNEFRDSGETMDYYIYVPETQSLMYFDLFEQENTSPIKIMNIFIKKEGNRFKSIINMIPEPEDYVYFDAFLAEILDDKDKLTLLTKYVSMKIKEYRELSK